MLCAVTVGQRSQCGLGELSLEGQMWAFAGEGRVKGLVEQRPRTLEERDTCVVGATAGAGQAGEACWGGSGLHGGSPFIPPPVPLHPQNCASVSYQEHPFFTLHKTKKTDIAAFVKEILGEDS